MPHPKPIAHAAYQQLADAYAKHIDTKPHNAYYDKPAMLSLLPNVAGKKVLDAGCGPGAYSQAIAEREATVVAIDASERMLELAAERMRRLPELESKVSFRLVDLSQSLTMFEENEFDVINAALCLDYIADWHTLFLEFNRILKPDGVFLFSCGHPAFDAEYFNTNQYFSVEQVQCVWSGFGPKITMPSFRRSLEEILSPVITAGFVIEKVHEPTPTEEFRKSDARRFKKLMHRPGFLCVRSRKQRADQS